jgi:hypothetical protein
MTRKNRTTTGRRCPNCGITFYPYVGNAAKQIHCSSKCMGEAKRSKMITQPNPSGLCMCGCGEQSPIATKTSTSNGVIKGFPQRYCKGHNGRIAPTRYVVNPVTQCWEWTLQTSRGYGYVKVNGKKRIAHRAVYEAIKGLIPPGMDLHHICGNRRCVNPDHVEPLPQHVHDKMKHPGQASPISIETAREIRRLAGPRKTRAIARQFGLHESTVRRIIKNRLLPEIAERN